MNPAFYLPLTAYSRNLESISVSATHPLDLLDVFGGQRAPVVLVPRQQLVDVRPVLVHQGVEAVLDPSTVLVKLQSS